MTGVGLTLTLTAGIATCAVVDRVVSAEEMALIVAFAGVDPDAGAVYIPFPSIVPNDPEPDTDHVTASDAENCLVPPSGTFALAGVIVSPGGGGAFELTDWHPTSNPAIAKVVHKVMPIACLDRFLRMMLKTMPLTRGKVHGSSGDRFSA